MPSPAPLLVVGIDIAAKTLAVVLAPAAAARARATTLANDATGWQALMDTHVSAEATPATALIVMEATGAYWQGLASVLHTAGWSVSVVSPAAVRSFARARLRRAKTDAVEVERLQTAARALERVISHAYTTARPGCTEKWLADTMATALLAEGADEVKAIVLSSGPRSVQSHAMPDGTTPIPSGATIRVDFVGIFGGYLADLARMACIGEPNATQRRYYDGLRAIEWAMIDACRPSTTAADVYAVGKAAYARVLGIETGKPHFGHSLGIGLHEEPLIHPANQTVLEPGMVLCIEPTHADAALGGFHIEDTIVVTNGAPRLLSDAIPTERMVVIA
jgi:Xaa-Pro aminopeptidase